MVENANALKACGTKPKCLANTTGRVATCPPELSSLKTSTACNAVKTTFPGSVPRETPRRHLCPRQQGTRAGSREPTRTDARLREKHRLATDQGVHRQRH